jgi:hypothetical protein
MIGQQFTLPIGYWHQDSFQKAVFLEPINGFVEEKVYDKTKSNVHNINQLLTACTKQIGSITTITPEVIQDLCVSDRDFLLLKLRELTFGSKIECVLTCPAKDCGKKMNVDFHTNIMVPKKKELTNPFFTIISNKTTIIYRLPNGSDLEFVADSRIKDLSQTETAIFQRCIKSINGRHPSESEINNLPWKLKEAVMKQMERVDPFTDLNMHAICPECEHEFVASFDIQDFFLKELGLNPDIFYREIHYLAYYYHWTEEMILSLPRWKRKKYVEYLLEEISR